VRVAIRRFLSVLNFQKDFLTFEPDTQPAQNVNNQQCENFFMVSIKRPFDNEIKSKPPLCFSKRNVDEVIGKLERILSSPADPSVDGLENNYR
jgi:4-aminobutyrate aminotransferase-like enzyme